MTAKEKGTGTITGVYQEIPLLLIDTDGQSVRLSQDDDHIVELSMSISRHGLLEPIVLRSKPGGRYQLLAGFHRLAAHHRLNRATIPAVIHDNNNAPVKAIALIENIVRRDMSLQEEVDAVQFLNSEEKMSPSQMCDLLGKNRDWINKRLMIPYLPAAIKEELLDGRISIRHAEIISRVESTSLQNLLLNNVLTQKLSARQTEELATLYQSSPSLEVAINAGAEKAQELQAAPEPMRVCDACKRARPLQNIAFIAVCADGCAPPDKKNGGDN